MKFNKRLIILAMLLVIVMSLNVSATMKTIKGTKYTTKYDTDLNKYFKIVDLIKGKDGKNTGEIRLADKIIQNPDNKEVEYTYGIIAGKIEIKEDVLGDKEIKVKKYTNNPGLYYNIDDKGKVQSLKSDEITIKKERLKNQARRYYLEINSKKNNVYFQEAIVVCDTCKISINHIKKTLDLDDTAYLMKKDTYLKKYKGKSKADRDKLKSWEIINITKIKEINFLKGDYKFTRENEKDLEIKFTFKAQSEEESDAMVGSLKLDEPSNNLLTLGLAAPHDEEYEEPIYFVKGNQIEIGLPEKALIHIDTDKSSGTEGLKPSIIIVNNQKTIISSPGESLLAINKDTKKKGTNIINCPNFFKSYNCLAINSEKKQVDARWTGKNEKVTSPLSKVTEPSMPALNFHLDGGDYIYFNSDYVKDPGGYFNLIKDASKMGKQKKTTAVKASSVLGLVGTSFPNPSNIDAIKIFPSQVRMPILNPWFKYGVTFSAKFPKTYVKGQFDTIICKHDEMTCYINGVPMSKALKKGLQCKLKCYSGKFKYYGDCIDFRCSQVAKCNELIPNSNKKPIRILFMSHMFDENAIKKVVNDMLFSSVGLLSIEPFKSNKDLFGAYYFTAKGTDIKSFLVKEDPKSEFAGTMDPKIPTYYYNCPGYTHIAYLFPLTVGQKGRSYAYPKRSEAYVYTWESPHEGNIKTFVHEMGHAFGKLGDEYLNHKAGKYGIIGSENCIAGGTKAEAEKNALSEWTKWLGQAKAQSLINKAKTNGWYGCGGDCDKNICSNYIRQAENSIMNNQQKSPYNWGDVGYATLVIRLTKIKSAARGVTR